MDKNRIKLFKFNFNVLEKNIPIYQSYLSPEELESSKKKITPELQKKQIISRGCLREVLGKQLNIPAQLVNIKTLEHGKPYLPDHPECFFNVSHSRELLIIGLSDQQIGLDIEFKNPNFSDNLAQNFMSSEELQKFVSLKTPSQKTNYFYQLWTAKEAISKYLGLGLKMNFTQDSIDNEAPVKFSSKDYSVQGQYLEIEQDYTLAICQKEILRNCEIIS